MITKQDLLEAIAECQGIRNPTANTCIKLASYLTILEHLDDGKENESAVGGADDIRHSTQSEPPKLTYNSGSEFSEAIKNKNIDDVVGVLDEAMSVIGGVHRKLYDAIIQKLNELGRG